jgi:hypothetical protein
MKNNKLKPLKELKFDSVGEEYIFLYESISNVLGGDNLEIASQPTIEELRKIYKGLTEESENYDDELKLRYEKNSIYWSDRQEKAIVDFLKEIDQTKKDRIFSTEIYQPLKKLVENIIFTYKLFRTDVEVRELQVDCMSFLVTKLEKYNPDTGAKAFAYLGTIAKHYLMGEKRNAYKMTKSNLDIDENVDKASERPENIYEMNEDEEVKDTNAIVFDEIILRLKEEMKKPKMLLNDKKVAEAIIYIFENHDMLKIYNKNLVYHLLKERTGLQTKEITYSLSRFKSFYRFFKQDFLKSKD